MIHILGTKRVLMLAFLFAMNIVLAVTVYMFLTPQYEQKQQELSTLKSDISTKQTDINRMQVEFDKLAEQQVEFDKLKKKGFFYNQDRRRAELVLERIQKQAGVVAAVANIQAGAAEDSPEAQKAEYKLLRSGIKLHIDAIDSVDVFRYIYLLERFFPGQIAVSNITLARKTEVTGPVLRAIASGINPVLVQADIDLTWHTMVPQSEVISPGSP